ncbi:MAG: phosphatase PAP2 family protein [Patescibacteria group bacterium]
MDISLFNFFYSFANRSPLFDGLIVFFASYLPYLLIFAFCVLPYTLFSGWKKRLFLFLGLALSGILSRGIIVPSIRFLYHRARPFEIFGFEPLITPSGFSFPSGHAALFFALSFFLFFFAKKAGIYALLLSLTIGVFRVVSGAHFPGDIVGGMILGFGSALLVFYLLPSKAVCASKEISENHAS